MPTLASDLRITRGRAETTPRATGQAEPICAARPVRAAPCRIAGTSRPPPRPGHASGTGRSTGAGSSARSCHWQAPHRRRADRPSRSRGTRSPAGISPYPRASCATAETRRGDPSNGPAIVPHRDHRTWCASPPATRRWRAMWHTSLSTSHSRRPARVTRRRPAATCQHSSPGGLRHLARPGRWARAGNIARRHRPLAGPPLSATRPRLRHGPEDSQQNGPVDPSMGAFGPYRHRPVGPIGRGRPA